MTKYAFTNNMKEISGFGGGYEETCRKMLIAAVEWLDDHPDADPQFYGYKNIYGVIHEDNDDAKALSKAVVDASGAEEVLKIDGLALLERQLRAEWNGEI
jgi:hypothetical protein